VSRRHARITLDEGTYFIEDLGSSNGTFVGPHPVTAWELAPGDRIRLGPNTVLRFTITDEAEEALQRKLFDASTRDALTGLRTALSGFTAAQLGSQQALDAAVKDRQTLVPAVLDRAARAADLAGRCRR